MLFARYLLEQNIILLFFNKKWGLVVKILKKSVIIFVVVNPHTNKQALENSYDCVKLK